MYCVLLFCDHVCIDIHEHEKETRRFLCTVFRSLIPITNIRVCIGWELPEKKWSHNQSDQSDQSDENDDCDQRDQNARLAHSALHTGELYSLGSKPLFRKWHPFEMSFLYIRKEHDENNLFAKFYMRIANFHRIKELLKSKSAANFHCF